MKQKTSIVPFVIALLVVAAGMYWYFSTRTENQPPISTGDGSGNQVQERFQTLVGELLPISFDTAVFSDARFNALVNISTPIAPEPTGRLDPFAAVSGVISGN
jgi:hypothetical protein